MVRVTTNETPANFRWDRKNLKLIKKSVVYYSNLAAQISITLWIIASQSYYLNNTLFEYFFSLQ